MAPLAYWEKKTKNKTDSSASYCAYLIMRVKQTLIMTKSFIKCYRNYMQISEGLGNRKRSHPLQMVTTNFLPYLAVCGEAAEWSSSSMPIFPTDSVFLYRLESPWRYVIEVQSLSCNEFPTVVLLMTKSSN